MTKNGKEVKKKKNRLLKSVVTIGIVLAVIWLFSSMFFKESAHSAAGSIKPATVKDSAGNTSFSEDFIKSVVSIEDSSDQFIRVSDESGLNVAVDPVAGAEAKRIFTGRRINIAITGVDSRLGAATRHADANHVISILIDSGKIEITSIPRDTPADAGFNDTTGQNKLTIVRAVKGRDAYLKELARIAKLDKIHYFVEFGFSQAMGILELLGYKDAQSTLQVLRSRKGLGGDDYQRSYNQGQFMRQAILTHFNKLDGPFGGILMHGGLAFVESNINYDIAKNITEQLAKHGFPHNSGDISIFVRPAIPIKFKVYDFTDKEIIKKLSKRIEDFNTERTEQGVDAPQPKLDVASVLNNALSRAAADTAKNPARAIKTLSVYFDQRAWCQVKDLKQRAKIRDGFEAILTKSYEKRKQTEKVQQVKYIIQSEKKVFETNNQ